MGSFVEANWLCVSRRVVNNDSREKQAWVTNETLAFSFLEKTECMEFWRLRKTFYTRNNKIKYAHIYFLKDL